MGLEEALDLDGTRSTFLQELRWDGVRGEVGLCCGQNSRKLFEGPHRNRWVFMATESAGIDRPQT